MSAERCSQFSVSSPPLISALDRETLTTPPIYPSSDMMLTRPGACGLKLYGSHPHPVSLSVGRPARSRADQQQQQHAAVANARPARTCRAHRLVARFKNGGECARTPSPGARVSAGTAPPCPFSPLLTGLCALLFMLTGDAQTAEKQSVADTAGEEDFRVGQRGSVVNASQRRGCVEGLETPMSLPGTLSHVHVLRRWPHRRHLGPCHFRAVQALPLWPSPGDPWRRARPRRVGRHPRAAPRGREHVLVLVGHTLGAGAGAGGGACCWGLSAQQLIAVDPRHRLPWRVPVAPQWSEGDVWHGRAELPLDTPVAFKYIQVGGDTWLPD